MSLPETLQYKYKNYEFAISKFAVWRSTKKPLTSTLTHAQNRALLLLVVACIYPQQLVGPRVWWNLRRVTVSTFQMTQFLQFSIFRQDTHLASHGLALPLPVAWRPSRCLPCPEVHAVHMLRTTERELGLLHFDFPKQSSLALPSCHATSLITLKNLSLQQVWLLSRVAFAKHHSGRTDLLENTELVALRIADWSPAKKVVCQLLPFPLCCKMLQMFFSRFHKLPLSLKKDLFREVLLHFYELDSAEVYSTSGLQEFFIRCLKLKSHVAHSLLLSLWNSWHVDWKDDCNDECLSTLSSLSTCFFSRTLLRFCKRLTWSQQKILRCEAFWKFVWSHLYSFALGTILHYTPAWVVKRSSKRCTWALSASLKRSARSSADAARRSLTSRSWPQAFTHR